VKRARYAMGLDGGGSTIRVAIVEPDLTVVGESQAGTVNPSVVGQTAAAELIRRAMREALAAACLTPQDIDAVAIGVAGASAAHSADWLRGVVTGVTPKARIVPSSDYEVALVGAHGTREGVLVAAGTGSVAYGINSLGQSALVGGWGYLIGDEGSGYWLGEQALRAVVRAADGRGPETSLSEALLKTLGLPEPRSLIAWLYQTGVSRTAQIAGLAVVALEQAAAGDPVARQIAERGADELALMVETVIRRLEADSLPIAFTGGILEKPSPLSEALCFRLGLDAIPRPRYRPVIGAAILALASG